MLLLRTGMLFQHTVGRNNTKCLHLPRIQASGQDMPQDKGKHESRMLGRKAKPVSQGGMSQLDSGGSTQAGWRRTELWDLGNKFSRQTQTVFIWQLGAGMGTRDPM